MNYWFRRRAAGVAAVITSAMVLVACADAAGSASDGAQTIPLGGTFEITGPVAELGMAWEKGAELGVDAANGTDGFEVNGETYRWELEVKDNQNLPDRAITHMQEYRSQGFDFLLGPGVSTSIGPVINSLGDYTPFIMTPTALGGQFIDHPAGENLFITHMPDVGDDGRIAGMVEILVDRYSPERVAILGLQDDSGELYSDLFSEYFDDAGVEIVYNEFLPSDHTGDFSAYISAISSSNPDMVIGPHLDNSMHPFMSQAAEGTLGDGVVFVGQPGTTVRAAEGVDIEHYVWPVSTRALVNPDDPQIAEVRAAWEETYGEEPDASSFWALSYYDSILILTQAMQKAGTTTDLDSIREVLLSETEWEGTVLEPYFNEGHQAVYSPQLGFLDNGDVTYEDAM